MTQFVNSKNWKQTRCLPIVYSDNGMLLNNVLIDSWTTALSCNVGESQKHNAEWKDQGAKEYIVWICKVQNWAELNHVVEECIYRG